MSRGSWQRSACTAAGWVSCSPRGTRLGHRALGMGILDKEGQTAARSGPLVPSPLSPPVRKRTSGDTKRNMLRWKASSFTTSSSGGGA